VDFEFDPEKAHANYRKHGVAFDEAIGVFADVYAISGDDRNSEGELRTLTLGMSTGARLLVVVWTMRGETVRIISARRATRTERVDYESQL
jgi:uncharacterized protein